MSGQVTAADLAVESEVARFTLGAVHETEVGAVYRYMQANGAKVANTLYSLHTDTGTSSTSWQVEDIADSTVTPGNVENVPICCPQIAMTDNYYAWVFIGPGSFTGTADTDTVVDTKLYVSAVAGAITDNATACLLEGVTSPVIVLDTATGKFHAHHEMYAQDLP